MSHDELGQRMKDQYESRTRYSLPRRTYTIIRLDGKAFHTFTKNFDRPFDLNFIDMMNETAKELCKQIQGAKFAYVQSDEISILLTDFSTIKTDAWFDGNIQKIASVSASIATAAFNNRRLHQIAEGAIKGHRWAEIDLSAAHAECLIPAHFDSRVFTIPDMAEIENYLIWRQNDATRNSIQMSAQNMYSQKELNGKGINELQELIFQKGVNWNDYPVGFKRGRMIVRKQESVDVQDVYVTVTDKETGQVIQTLKSTSGKVIRNRWVTDEEIPIFTQNRGYLADLIPVYGTSDEK